MNLASFEINRENQRRITVCQRLGEIARELQINEKIYSKAKTTEEAIKAINEIKILEAEAKALAETMEVDAFYQPNHNQGLLHLVNRITKERWCLFFEEDTTKKIQPNSLWNNFYRLFKR